MNNKSLCVWRKVEAENKGKIGWWDMEIIISVSVLTQLFTSGSSQCLPSTNHWMTVKKTRSSSQNHTMQPPTLRQRVWMSSPSTSEAPGRTLTSARWSTTLGMRTCKWAGQVTLHLAGWSVLGGRAAAAAATSSLFSRMPPPLHLHISRCLPCITTSCIVASRSWTLICFSLNCFIKSPPPPELLFFFLPTCLYIYTKVR